jgi:hypothetical protein
MKNCAAILCKVQEGQQNRTHHGDADAAEASKHRQGREGNEAVGDACAFVLSQRST